MNEPERLDVVTDDDHAAISNLLLQLASHNSLSRQSLEEVCAGRDTELWVIRRERRIIAMATLILTQNLHARVATMEDVVVDEHMRRKGVATVLMQAVIASARKKGARYVELTSSPARVAGNALYPTLGFVSHETNVYRLPLETT